MNVMDEESANMWFRIMAIPARLLRATATSFSPDFWHTIPFATRATPSCSRRTVHPGWDSAKESSTS
jgi:hypothetical protein